ncbi:MAG TPA: hypothetical protein DDW50_17900 [Firmicutes bacterium]|jgi:hypothetical protein|nr:hypothetical protein [Bacillota bacterium]
MSKQEVVEIIRKIDDLKQSEHMLINLRGTRQIKIFARRKDENMEDCIYNGWVFPWYIYENSESYSYDTWPLDKLVRFANHFNLFK